MYAIHVALQQAGRLVMRLRALLLASLMVPAAPALAQEAAEAVATDVSDTIIVTGTCTKGLDAIATYRVDLGNAGELAFTGRQDTPGALNQVPGITLFGRLESLRIARGQPRDKLNLGLDWSMDWLGVTARTNRYGSVLAPGADQFNDVWLSSKWVTDLDVRATPWGGLELAIGATNIFSVYPPRNPTGQGVDPVTGATRNHSVNNCFLPYSSFSPFGFNGRFLYGRVAYRF
jgi:iron complex outermembrane receptor protein